MSPLAMTTIHSNKKAVRSKSHQSQWRNLMKYPLEAQTALKPESNSHLSLKAI